MLAASVRGEILRLLLSLRDELGLAILVVTHDLGLAWTVADRVAVMYLGKIIELGPAEEVLTRPQHPYTKALLAVVPDARERRRGRTILAGEPPDPSNIPPGCRFHPRCPEAEVPGVCVDERPRLTELSVHHLSACHFAERLYEGTAGIAVPASDVPRDDEQAGP